MKILMLTPVFDMGGTETYIINLSSGLISRNHEVQIVSAEGVRLPDLDRLGIKHHLIKSLCKKGPFSTLSSVLKICKIIKQTSPDIIHTSSLYTTLTARIAVILSQLPRKRRPKVLLTLHGGPTKDIEKKSARILRFLKVNVIAITKTSRNLLIKAGLQENKIYQVYNGVDLIKLRQLQIENSQNKFIQKLKAQGKIVIGFFGRLSEEKGVLPLVKAMKKISEVKKDLVLIILGDGPCRPEVDEYIFQNKLQSRIHILGFDPDPYLIMKDCDLIILPSLWDTCPMVLLEAMALGRNILACAVGGIPEVLADAGHLVAPQNEDSLISAVIDFINLGRASEYNIKGQLRVETLFSMNSMVKNTENVYNSVLDK